MTPPVNATAFSSTSVRPATTFGSHDLVGSHDLAHLSDGMLVERTKDRDPVAFRELLGRHQPTLLRLAQRLVRNDNDAQEILQEVFITTWQKLGGFQDRSQVGSWLYRVTVNASLMHLRTSRRRLSAAAFDSDEPSADASALSEGRPSRPDQQLESLEERQVLQDGIERLPPPLRSVLILRTVHGCSTRETGRMLGLTDVAVKTRLFRARRLLREHVKKYFIQ